MQWHSQDIDHPVHVPLSHVFILINYLFFLSLYHLIFNTSIIFYVVSNFINDQNALSGTKLLHPFACLDPFRITPPH